MANPTTNFGWVMPTSSSLVTNLPADFNTFGQAVDTSMAQLKGGSTGQVLSKTSATDMAFTWVTPTDQTPLTTKGDLFTFTTVDARLAVGNNGETLVADSSTSTGLRYTAGTVQANPVLNSAFQIFQRGTSTAGSTTAFGADRWQAYRGTTGSTYSRQVTNDTTNLPSIQYCLRVQRDSGTSATNQIILGQNFETVNSIPYAGKTVTFSFYARAGANYSPTSSALPAYIYTGTGTDQNGISSVYTGNAASLSGTATLTTTWQRFTFTGTLPTTMTEMSIQFPMNPVGTAGANDYYEITGVQLDIGSVALPFRTYAGTIQGELAADERYYERLLATSTAGVYAVGFASSATACDFFVKFSTDKRVAISAIDFANINASDLVNTPPTVTNITIVMSGVSGAWVRVSAASGFVQYRPYFLLNNNNAAGYIGFSAEL